MKFLLKIIFWVITGDSNNSSNHIYKQWKYFFPGKRVMLKLTLKPTNKGVKYDNLHFPSCFASINWIYSYHIDTFPRMVLYLCQNAQFLIAFISNCLSRLLAWTTDEHKVKGLIPYLSLNITKENSTHIQKKLYWMATECALNSDQASYKLCEYCSVWTAPRPPLRTHTNPHKTTLD